jgi:hypothetical protein
MRSIQFIKNRGWVYMIVKFDSKLLRVMNLLGVDTVCLGNGGTLFGIRNNSAN